MRGVRAVEPNRQMQACGRLKLVDATPQQYPGGRQKYMAASRCESVHNARSFRKFEWFRSTDPNDRRSSAELVAARRENRNERAFPTQ